MRERKGDGSNDHVPKALLPAARSAIVLLEDSLKSDQRIMEDQKRLKRILESTKRCSAGSYEEDSGFISLHRQFVSEPNGGGVGAPSQGRCHRSILSGSCAVRVECARGTGDEKSGVDISHQRSKHVDELQHIDFDYVITVCDHARETCPIFPAGVKLVHMGFDDPPFLARASETEEEALVHYRRVRDEITRHSWQQCRKHSPQERHNNESPGRCAEALVS